MNKKLFKILTGIVIFLTALGFILLATANKNTIKDPETKQENRTEETAKNTNIPQYTTFQSKDLLASVNKSSPKMSLKRQSTNTIMDVELNSKDIFANKTQKILSVKEDTRKVPDYIPSANKNKETKRIKQEYNDFSTDIYPVSIDGKEAIEFEIVLKNKPQTNEISFNLDFADNLEFHYQPPLNISHPDKKCSETECWEIVHGEKRISNYRPENVVGSFAVYHKNKMNNEYKTGKAFHIYRPKIMDAEKNQVWGELRYNKQNKKLALIIPSKFLDTAKYPVYIDPTFGNQAEGSSWQSLGNEIHGSDFTVSNDGSLDNIKAYVTFPGCLDADFKYAMYDNSNNLVSSSSEETNYYNHSSSWVTLNASGEFSAGDYYLTAWSTYVDGAGVCPQSIFPKSEIRTINGFKKIKDIRRGDIVITEDKPSEVLKILSSIHKNYLLINNQLGISHEHQVKTDQGWIRAGNLEIGDKIITFDGFEEIKTFEEIETEGIRMYDLSLHPTHNYYADGYLVHNWEDHIIIAYDTVTDSGAYDNETYNGYPDPWSPATEDKKFSIYANYTLTCSSNGQTCSVNDDCCSGNCVDSYCCDTVCDGVCEACDISGSEGTCSYISSGTDPDGDCDGCANDCEAETTCDGNGNCQTTSCSAQEACQNGSCSGSNYCFNGGKAYCSCQGDNCFEDGGFDYICQAQCDATGTCDYAANCTSAENEKNRLQFSGDINMENFDISQEIPEPCPGTDLIDCVRQECYSSGLVASCENICSATHCEECDCWCDDREACYSVGGPI